MVRSRYDRRLNDKAEVGTSMIAGLISLILLIGIAGVILNWQSTQIGAINTNISEASYIIFQDDSGVTCAKNGTSGVIDFRDSNASELIQNVVDVTGGSILIKAGTYDITQAIMILKDSISIYGEGEATILRSAASVYTFQLGNDSTNSSGLFTMSGVVISNMQLDGNDIGLKGIYSVNSANCKVDTVYIHDFVNWGVHIAFNHSMIMFDLTIRECGNFTTITGGGIKIGSELLELDAASNANLIDKCTIEENVVGIWIVGGIVNTISNTVIEGNHRYGILLDAQNVTYALPFLTQIDGCYFELNNLDNAANQSDIYMTGLIYQLAISNCYFSSSNMEASIMSRGADNIKGMTLTNNRFVTDDIHPLDCELARRMTLIGNYFQYHLNIESGQMDGLSIAQFVHPIDAFDSLMDGTKLYIENGIWNIDRTIEISVGNVTIEGNGEGSILQLDHDVNDNLISADGRDGLMFKNFRIDAAHSYNSGGSAIELNDCDMFLIDSLHILRGNESNILITGTSNLGKITNCILSYSAIGIHFETTVVDNMVNGNLIGCTVPIVIDSGCLRNVIINNDWYRSDNNMTDAGTGTLVHNNMIQTGAWIS